MLEMLSQLSVERMAILTGVSAIFFVTLLVPLTSIIVTNWRRYRESHLAASVILDMLDRGMEPDEITRVLQAAGMEGDQNPLVAHCTRGQAAEHAAT